MKRNAAITVSAAARYADGERENSIYTVSGTLEETSSGWRVSYDEPEESGMTGTATRLDVSARRALLTRTGGVRSTFAFCPGEVSASVYDTPFGKLSAVVRTNALRTRLDGHGGLIGLDYELTVGGIQSVRRLKIRIQTEEACR